MRKTKYTSIHKPASNTLFHSNRCESNITAKNALNTDHDPTNIKRNKSKVAIQKRSWAKKQLITTNSLCKQRKKQHSRKSLIKNDQKQKSNSNSCLLHDSPSRQQEIIDYFIINRFKSHLSKRNKNNHREELLLAKIKDSFKQNKIDDAITLILEYKEDFQMSLDLKYILGVCYVINEQYQKALKLFKSILQTKVKKEVYLMLSFCYKQLDDVENSESILTKCILKFPKYYDAYVYRGKLYIKVKMYKLANQDFQEAIYLHPDKQIAYIGKGDCLRSMQNYREAIEIYNSALEIQNNKSILLRRSICYLELEKWSLALSDLDQFIQQFPKSSEALYYKGVIFTKKANYKQATIYFQQAIKYATNKKTIARSLFEISKIKVNERNYYEAFYTLSRAQYSEISIKSLQKLKIFIHGVTNLMKRNYKQGIQLLVQSSKEQGLSKSIKPLFYSSKAYGQMHLNRFEQAHENFLKLENQIVLDNPNSYNKFICQGILSSLIQKYQQALKCFSKASKIFPQKLEPNFYKAIILIRFATKIIPKNMQQKKKQYKFAALKQILKNPTNLQNNFVFYYIRAILFLSIQNPEEALKDIQISSSIKEIKNHKVVYFYVKGLSLGGMKKFKEAIQCFDVAIQNDVELSRFPQIFLNRSKCYLLSGQLNHALQDIRMYITHKLESLNSQIQMGITLLYTGYYENAVLIFSSILKIQKSSKVLKYRAACYFSMKNLQLVQSDLISILDLQKDTQILFDLRMIQIFTRCQKNSEPYSNLVEGIKKIKKQGQSFGFFFKQYDFYFYKAILYVFVPNYKKAIQNFQRCLQIQKIQTSLNCQLKQQFQGQMFLLKKIKIIECNYNLAICLVLDGNIPEAILKLRLCEKMLDQKIIIQGIQTLIQIMQKEQQTLIVSPQQHKQQKIIQIFPFSYLNRLCSIFPELTINLSKIKINTRLSFCLPFTEKPDVFPSFDDRILQTLDLSLIQIRPEAPWIKRNRQGVIFTDQMIQSQIQISEPYTEQSHIYRKDQTQEQVQKQNSETQELFGHFQNQLIRRQNQKI